MARTTHGLTPTITLIHQRTGGGFATLKDWLDAWTIEAINILYEQAATTDEQAIRLEAFQTLVAQLRGERDQARIAEQIASIQAADLTQRLQTMQQQLADQAALIDRLTASHT